MKSLLLVFIGFVFLYGSFIDRAVDIAKSKLGSPYRYGKSGENSFDCSGFVYYVYHKRLGFYLPRTAYDMSNMSEDKIFEKDALKRGDLLFFDTRDRGYVNHVGIYLGNKRFIHASSGKAYQVTISPLDKGFYRDRFLWGIRLERSSKLHR